MFKENWRKHAHLKSRLVKERQMMSLMEKEIAVIIGDLVQNHENWVRMWVDTGHIVTCDDGKISAYRGIDFDGQLMWLVQHPRKKHGYHSLHADPFDAIEEAQTAWKERARVKAKWPEVKALARDLIIGRKSFTVTREDAYRSALCSAGIDAFMARMRMPLRQQLSGRTAACLMLIDSQLGFVIEAASERVNIYSESPQNEDGGGLLREQRTG